MSAACDKVQTPAFLSLQYLEEQKAWLLARLASKKEIINSGGERALLHSPNDLIRIKFALRRIEQGQYGLCPDCGGCIEEERLAFEPEIVFCSRCQLMRCQ